VSLRKTGRSMSEKASTLGDRARDAATQAIPQARRAGVQARQAGTTAVHGVRRGTRGARGWAAPRLDSAADTITATAPKVSSALHRAAKQVKPAPPPKTGIRRLLDWRWMVGLGVAVAAAGGAAVATMRRYKSATADAKHAADSATDESGQPGSPDDSAMNQVNGRVTTSR
jgi:hypothetical protein